MPFSHRRVFLAIKKHIILLLTMVTIFFGPIAHSSPRWGYNGSTIPPSRWGKYFPACQAGGAQSPVDIKANRFSADHGQSILFHFEKAPISTIVNNGHTIQVNFSSPRSTVMIGPTRYNLLQFHFHSPSENTINGRHFPLEMHVVARSQQHPNKLAVIAFLYRLGRPNQALSLLWRQIPPTGESSPSLRHTAINLYRLIPAQINQDYRFVGSLTTPPCTHRIQWFVAKKRRSLSNHQLAVFNKVYLRNNRPIQPW